jgi:hypothetical protein
MGAKLGELAFAASGGTREVVRRRRKYEMRSLIVSLDGSFGFISVSNRAGKCEPFCLKRYYGNFDRSPNISY